jgi:hypothetical protein
VKREPLWSPSPLLNEGLSKQIFAGKSIKNFKDILSELKNHFEFLPETRRMKGKVLSTSPIAQHCNKTIFKLGDYSFSNDKIVLEWPAETFKFVLRLEGLNLGNKFYTKKLKRNKT